MTARFKLRRLWIVHVSPWMLVMGGLVLLPEAFVYASVWQWIIPIVSAVIVAFSVQTVCFWRDGEIRFRHHVGIVPIRNLRLEKLRLGAEGDDWAGDEEDHIAVHAQEKTVVFPCDKPYQVIRWLRSNLEIPQARALDEADRGDDGR